MVLARRGVRGLVVGLLAVLLLVPLVGVAARADFVGAGFRVQVVSTRADMVTGGDVLVRVHLPRHVSPGQVTVSAGGRDVTGAFRADGGSLVGLVDGLSVGRNTIVARVGGSGRERLTASRAVVNHPITGPVFSGPHQSPFVCETDAFRVPVVGASLVPVADGSCSAGTRVDYVYRSTSGWFRPLTDLRARPADLARTTNNDGRTVNYIVRVESGTINRGIYELAVLHDPVTDPAPGPVARPAGWNERLVYSYGGGCRAGYRQGGGTETFPPPMGRILTMPSPVHDAWLAQGYAVAVSSLTVLNNNCNDVISAETTMMVKERFVEQYGEPRHTIGWGESGGSMQQHLIAQNYPGLLDGLLPGASFPDTLVQLVTTSDCALLNRAFDTSAESWTSAQRAAVAGWGSAAYCTSPYSADWVQAFQAGAGPDPTYGGCSVAVPRDLVYHPATNPTGARCTYQDNAVNVYGRDPATGFARRPLDNVGVQYGLDAFDAGVISAEQFLDLNERVGGFDIDGGLVPTRTVGDTDAVEAAYRTGRVNVGANLDTVPIIDLRTYFDAIPDPHDSVRSHSMRARLVAAHGSADNHVMLVTDRAGTGAAHPAAVGLEALRLMDQWLTAVEADTSTTTLADKIVRHRPADAVDACYQADGTRVTDRDRCADLYPTHENPRLAAGEPLVNDVLKCALKPVSAADYARPLTEDQLARLRAAFPGGVCDYSRPGVGQRAPEGSWSRY
ncbi:DUF6351 family protein [Actinophytocola gossypii]|uniref:DUF6351 domain-containing protein n=1 Tax=Actinophytocola gossypii TaxID=2812003 RepID=A0ABT2J9L0_9PSEU|nr:DUF6351 family protein [Actinophytocola gossypii]MCT2584463.1 hypothetical protein [Actinophytocola gossypii]